MSNHVWQTIASYPTFSKRLYALLRWFICPFGSMERYLPRAGTIVDVGCGEGVLVQYMGRTGGNRRVIGIDRDSKRLEAARLAAKGLPNVSFRNANAQTVRMKKVHGIVFSDFLHHIPYKEQDRLLKTMSKYLVKGGILLIKEIDRKDGVRRMLSRMWDYVFYPDDTIYYRDLTQLAHQLQRYGYMVVHRQAARHFPGSTHLLICSKT
jgi:2-polyprenyl-3-methyl-5-hydroxy-6-metoxy-1,4-benzoquinol methylase